MDKKYHGQDVPWTKSTMDKMYHRQKDLVKKSVDKKVLDKVTYARAGGAVTLSITFYNYILG